MAQACLAQRCEPSVATHLFARFGGELSPRHATLTDERLPALRAIALVAHNVAASIGLEAATFAGHSLRAGLATSAVRAGKADRDVMRQMGSRSRSVFDRYVRAARLWEDNAAAGLL